MDSMLGERRSLTRRVALLWLARALAAATLLTATACSSSSSEDPTPGPDGGQSDALASDASSDGGADAVAPPGTNTDPQDLDPSNGDPSLDIASSSIYFDGGQPWVRAAFYGTWPPDATLYAWSCQVFLSTANAPVVTYTVRSLSGTQTDFAEGLPGAKITFAPEAKGFRVLFADASIAFDRYALQCTAQKVKASASVQDDSGPFLVTTKEARAFGP
jgi:hypothetical protein